MTSDAGSAVDRYFRALNDLDRDAYVACFSEEAILRDPYGGPVRQGEEGLNAFFDGMEKTWASFEMTPQEQYRAGDRVAAPWTATATAKNGKTANFAGVNVFTLDKDGRIRQLDGYWDYQAMAAQLKG